MRRQLVSWMTTCILLASGPLWAHAQTGTTMKPVVTVKATDENASEIGPDSGTFTLYRDGPTNSPLIVYYHLAGTASNGNDYKLLPGFAVLAAGKVTADITVMPLASASTRTEAVSTVELQLYAPIEPFPRIDDRGLYVVGSPSNAVVTIAKAPHVNIPPVVRLLEPANDGDAGLVFAAGANIGLTAKASDADGTVRNVTFYSGTNVLGTGASLSIEARSESLFHFTWTNVAAGEYVVSVTATDDAGASTRSDAVKIRVVTIAEVPPTNRPPAVQIVRPEVDAGGSVQLAAGSAITLLAQADDSDGTVTNVLFFSGTNVLGAGVRLALTDRDHGLFSFTWTNAAAGKYEVSAMAIDNEGAAGFSDAIIIEVLPPEESPVVTVTASDPNASEVGPDPGTFTVQRRGSTNGPLTVFYSLDGTAANGRDYKTLAGSVTIPAGATSADVTVMPVPDSELPAESDETVILQLRPAITPVLDSGLIRTRYLVGSPSNAVVTIQDAPHANVPPSVQILRPEQDAVFNATANLVLVAKANDSDGVVSSVEFFEGTNSLGIVTNPSVDMRIREIFELKWPNVVSGEYDLTVRATDNDGVATLSASVHVTVKQETPPPVTNPIPVVTIYARDPIASQGGNPGTTNVASFIVHRTDGTNSDLTVFYSIGGTASNGVDYAELSGTVTIPAGHRNGRISIVPLNDIDDPQHWIETVTLMLQPSPVASASIRPSYLVGRPARASIIIVDRNSKPPRSHRLADGAFHARVAVKAGIWHRVDASDDLKSWETVSVAVATEGEISFVDSGAPDQRPRFYRIVSLASAPDEVED